MNKIKLIALDLDGTALTPQNKVAETTTDAVRRAREAGVYVAVSTGRICGEARDFAVDLDADDLMVTSGGATLSSISGEGCTMRMSMPWEAAVRAAAAVERIGMIAMIYVGETLLITPYDDLGFGSYKTNEGYLTSKKVVPSVAEYIADHHLSVDKIFVRSQDPVTLLRTDSKLCKYALSYLCQDRLAAQYMIDQPIQVLPQNSRCCYGKRRCTKPESHTITNSTPVFQHPRCDAADRHKNCCTG